MPSHYVINVIGLTWPTCEVDLPWVSVNPLSGSTAANAHSPLDVIFNSTGLTAGTYTGNLCLFSNDQAQPVAGVPLTLTVNSYGVELAASTATGMGKVGTTVTYTLQLTNTGSTTDTFAFSASGNTWNVQLPVSQTLAAGETIGVQVMVTIPANAAAGSSDSVAIEAASQSDALQVAQSVLTTFAIKYTTYLPLIAKNH